MLHTRTLHAIIQVAEREVNNLKSEVMQPIQELARSRAREARFCEVTHDEDWTLGCDEIAF
jgi:cell division protein FtsB